MKTLTKVLIVLLAIIVAVPTTSYAKKKKEKKPFKFELPEQLSGDHDIDTYLLSCDTLWTKIQSYSESMDTYTYKEDTLRNVNGNNYVMAHMENAQGEYLTRAAVNWQLVDAIAKGAQIVLDAADIGIQTAAATASLPSLGFKALAFAKYVKAGPIIIGKGGKEIKELAIVRKTQLRSWKAMKQEAVDPSTLGVYNEEQLKSLKKCCFIKKIDLAMGRELTDEERTAQDKLLGGLDIKPAPEIAGQVLEKEESTDDVMNMINEEEI